MNELSYILSNFSNTIFVEARFVDCFVDFDIDTTASHQIESINNPRIWWNNLPVFYTLLSIVVLAITYFISRSITNARKKKETELALAESERQLFLLKQKALQVQMNPHMLFNALNSIQLYIVTGDTDNALRHLAIFSKFLRKILHNASKNFVTIEEELETIQLYLQIEDLRFDGRFEFKVETAPEIDIQSTEIPSMILQPYIDNAINHGLLHTKEKGQLHIKFEKRTNDTIVCIIQDNGVGRQKAIEIRENSGIVRKSNGMQITQEQLELMNRYALGKYAVCVTDLYNNQNESYGTRVEIQINVK